MSRALVEAFHFMQLAEHGGAHGLRDDGALESAIARPRNREAYGEDTDLADLAAAYVYAIATSHRFVDGNKRTAFVTVAVFLELNGWELAASNEDVAKTIHRVASGDMSEEQVARWLRRSMRRAG